MKKTCFQRDLSKALMDLGQNGKLVIRFTIPGHRVKSWNRVLEVGLKERMVAKVEEKQAVNEAITKSLNEGSSSSSSAIGAS